MNFMEAIVEKCQLTSIPFWEFLTKRAFHSRDVQIYCNKRKFVHKKGLTFIGLVLGTNMPPFHCLENQYGERDVMWRLHDSCLVATTAPSFGINHWCNFSFTAHILFSALAGVFGGFLGCRLYRLGVFTIGECLGLVSESQSPQKELICHFYTTIIQIIPGICHLSINSYYM